MPALIRFGFILAVCAGAIGAASVVAGKTSSAAMSIQVLSPTTHVSVLQNGKFPVHVKITGLKLAPNAMGRTNVPGEGHFHFYLDCIPGVSYTRPNNMGACWAGAEGTTHTVFDLAASHVPVGLGPHTLFLALARNDHVLYPVAPAAISFTVTRPELTIQVLSPTQPVTVAQNGKIPIHLKIAGLRLAPNAMGRANVSGEGHFHFYVDCIPSVSYSKPNNIGACWAGAEASENTVFDLRTSHVKVTPGTHVLLLALARNDHILYRAPVASVVFTVTK